MSSKRLPPMVLVSLVFAALVLVPACAQKKPTAVAEKAPPAATPVPAPAAQASPAPAPAAAPDILAQDLDHLNRGGYLRDAFFDYDRAELREDARTSLAADARWLQRYPSVRILIEGHCDDRGTDSYNLALGQRRASAAEDYLAALGVASDRVKVVSYGKERPFCTSDDDTCWQENRRGHVVITAK
ncbi:MAG TPA: peptidoglycan-associated lipoprotein Pal [Thermoanaerobaculia bacterium]|nr:peptidoglycan-associated lipoprotein Pal [Thermoanaerobaculia bacterium]